MRYCIGLGLVSLFLLPGWLVRAADESVLLDLEQGKISAALVSADERAFCALRGLAPEDQVQLPGGMVEFRIERGRAVVTWAGSSTPKRFPVETKGTVLRLRGLGGEGPDPELLFLAHPRFGLPFVVNAKTRTFRLADTVIHLLDADLDGKYGEPESDLVVLVRRKEVWITRPFGTLPLPAPFGGIEVKDGGARVELRREPEGCSLELREALTLINEARRAIGLKEARWDPALSEACRKHCRYMEIHGIRGGSGSTHVEEVGLEGYSPEGALAARNSCNGTGDENAAFHVQGILAMFYHRLPILRPGATTVGIMHAHGCNMVDAVSAAREARDGYPIAYPAADQFDVPLEFDTSEWPRPLPGGLTRAGFPITVDLSWGPELEGVAAKVTRADDDRIVPSFVTWPGNPASEIRPKNDHAILIIPADPLEPFTKYRVALRWQRGDDAQELDWEFRTGNTSHGATWRPLGRH